MQATSATTPDPIFEYSDADEFSPSEGVAARVGRWIGQACVLGLIAIMAAEMVARSLLGLSIQISNEVGGYALAAITFVSLGSGQLLHAYHRVHFVESRLSGRGKAWLRLAFDVASLVVTLVLLAELVRFEWITWNSGDVSATGLMTPLWMPRLFMPLGALLLAWALLRTLVGDWRRVRAAAH